MDRRIFLFLVLSCCLIHVNGHNWMTSPARGNKGSNFNGWTSPPCPPKGGRVHVQVAAGQRFPLEWSSGHGFGSYTFLAVMKASDENQMIRNTAEVFNDYINSAPPEALTYMSDSQTVHVSHMGPSTDASLDVEITAQWPRPSVFRPFTDARVYRKKTSATALDRRVKYQSATYPWLISVHKLALNEDRPEDMDSILMEIPAEYPPGQYVIQYSWSGYYDCTDVNVLSVQSIDIWGSPAPAGQVGFDQVHHCLYTPTLTGYSAFTSQCFELLPTDTIDACKNICAANNDQYNACDAVMVSPVNLPSPVKFPGTFVNPTSPGLPTSCNSVIANLKGPVATASVCYNIHSGNFPIVGPPYKIVTDPEDPVFYSTCYIKKSAWVFAQSCPECAPALPRADFRFGDGCITCKDMNRNYFTIAAPFWKLSDVCEDCDPARG